MGIAVESRLPSGIEQLTRYMEDPTVSAEDRAALLRIAENLSRPSDPFEPRGSNNSWQETLYRVTATTTISGTTTETIMVPDFTLPANYLVSGRCLRYTLIGDYSTAITTPGTWTWRLRYGGVGGTVLAVSGAYAPDPTAASTTVPWMVEWYLTMRADGASGSAFVQGRLIVTDFDDASVTTLINNLNMLMIPTSAPAAVTINTTTANALSPTNQSNVTTGSLRTNLAFLEALN
jgi:hypothetical protein